MPGTPTYPGVYVEEIPSGIRTIAGVATSITAFLGRAVRGPVNVATTITSYADFERTFGGINHDFPMSYAVRDFYQNGGKRAVIVRLVGKNAAAATANKDGGLTLRAANQGTWGNNLRYLCDNIAVKGDSGELFNLQIFELVGPDKLAVHREVIRNVSCNKDAKRRVDRVLQIESEIVRAVEPTDNAQPEVYDTIPSDQQSLKEKLKTLDANLGKDSEKLGASHFKSGEDSDTGDKTGLAALDSTDLFNLLCIPPDNLTGDIPKDVYSEALSYCMHRRAMLIVDPPSDWKNNELIASGLKSDPRTKLGELNLQGSNACNAILTYPRIRQTDADPDYSGQLDTFAACGMIAGIIARTDATRGVWKAPAGLDASLNGIHSLAVKLTDEENGILNQVGINCLRSFPAAGNVVWGARTMDGDDQLGSEWKYIPVRRTALYIEESLYRGTHWAVFEPNDEPLWAQLRLNIGAFMNDLFRQGAFQGRSPRESYFVKCDKDTTTQNDINRGIVNVVVGFAPLKPAEFVVIKLTQIAGQIET
ncbi:phage tail sheath family protein [Gimesia algae]|uniref:Phage tail sheath protein n=1 Tax=Gimesia algae TaxID=2527971 RepID=A0A517VBR6_9PLAN|nr:phage tail sheath C-terminal domain-containing protein [Gimesia algae]QDT90447.1 Phage tail sheath protein [Gimesia algae]